VASIRLFKHSLIHAFTHCGQPVTFFAVPITPLMCCYSWTQCLNPSFNSIHSSIIHSISLHSFIPHSFHFIQVFSISPAAALCVVAGPAHRARRFSVRYFFDFPNRFSMAKKQQPKKPPEAKVLGFKNSTIPETIWNNLELLKQFETIWNSWNNWNNLKLFNAQNPSSSTANSFSYLKLPLAG